jgi:hypothetical protein
VASGVRMCSPKSRERVSDFGLWVCGWKMGGGRQSSSVGCDVGGKVGSEEG